MREKFRAWHRDRMIYADDFFSGLGSKQFMINNKEWALTCEEGEICCEQDSDLMQYTELKNNICQSDIIKYPVEHPVTGKIEWFIGEVEKDEYGFIVYTPNRDGSFPLRDLEEVIDQIEILGNRFENPELLDT